MNQPTCETSFAAQVASYAMGELTSAEREAMEQHLDTCVSCEADLRSLSPALESFARDMPPVQPPAKLKQSLQERIRTNAEAPSNPSKVAGLRIAAGSDGSFVPTPVSGVEIRPLHADSDADRLTFLVRMHPGSSYPAHVHQGTEECYVLQGDLRMGDIKMVAGDYQVADPGSEHPLQHTNEGCLILITARATDYPAVAAMLS